MKKKYLLLAVILGGMFLAGCERAPHDFSISQETDSSVLVTSHEPSPSSDSHIDSSSSDEVSSSEQSESSEYSSIEEQSSEEISSEEYTSSEETSSEIHEHAFDHYDFDTNYHYEICECGEELSKDIHVYDDGKVTTEPGRITTGVRTYTCEVCGHTKTETIPALNYNLWSVIGSDGNWAKDTDMVKNYSTGLFEVTMTFSDGATFKIRKDHSWTVNYGLNGIASGENIKVGTTNKHPVTITFNETTHAIKFTVAPHDNGDFIVDETSHYKECSYCHKHSEEGEHIWDEGTIIKEMNEIEDGEILYTCTVCGYEKSEIVPAHAHVYENAFTYDETYHWHAAICGHDVVKDKEEHVMEEEVFDPTIVEEGYTLHYCSVCDYSYKDNYLEPLDHNYSSSWSHDEEKHWHACIDEGFEDLKYAENPHKFVDEVIEPSISEEGYTRHTCSTCGYSYIDNYVAPTGHEYSSSWTYDEDNHWHVCVDDGYDYLKYAESPHTFEDEIVPATHTEQGYTKHTCSVCGYSYNDNETPVLQYIVTWKNYDGEVITTSEYNIGETPVYDGETPVKPSDSTYHYSFVGWTPEITPVNDDIEYTALFNETVRNDYLVTFDANGGTGGPTQIVTSRGGSITIPSTTPKLEGHTFCGWNTFGNEKTYVAGNSYVPTEDVTFHAIWCEHCHECDGTGTTHYNETCSQCSGNGSVRRQDVRVCSSCSGSGRRSVTIPCADCGGVGKKYSAGGVAIPQGYTCPTCNGSGKGKTVTDTCGSCGGTGGYIYYYNEKCSYCNGKGYNTRSRTCQSCNGSPVHYPAAPTLSEKTYYSVTLVAIDGYEYSLNKVNWQKSNVFDDLDYNTECTFYQRVAETDDETFKVSSLPLKVTTNDIPKFTITYHLDGGSNNYSNPSVFTIRDEVTLYNPSKTGYDFVGWFLDEGLTQSVTRIESGTDHNIHLYAKWSIITYTISYELNGGINHGSNRDSFNVNTETFELLEPTKTDYVFSGWFTDEKFVTAISSVEQGTAKNLTVYAKWVPAFNTIAYHDGDEVLRTSFTVTFDSRGGSGVASQKVTATNALKYPERPTRSGYAFMGWYTDVNSSTPFDFSQEIKDDIVLYAKWFANSSNYPVWFNGYSNSFYVYSMSRKNYIGYNDTYKIFMPLETGSYTFSTARSRYSAYIEIRNSTRSTILKESSYSGTFSLNLTAGEPVYVRLYANETDQSSSYGISVFDVSISISGPNPAEGGTAKLRGTYTFESETFSIPNLEKVGYTFDGWYSEDTFENKVEEVKEGTHGDIELFAKWNYIDYSITYNLNGGTNSSENPTMYHVDEEIELKNPTKDEYTFDGWYSDSGFTHRVYDIPKGSTEDIVLYAKWIDYEVSISYDNIHYVSYYKEVNADSFNATALDTDGNTIDVVVQIIAGQFTPGSSIAVRLTAFGLYDIYDTLVIEDVRVYDNPTLTYNTEKDFITINDSLVPSLFNAGGKDTYDESLLVNISTKDGEYKAGDVVTIIISTTDITGNTTTVEIEGVKVYGGPIFTRDETVVGIKESDEINSELFGVSAVDYFSEALETTTNITSYYPQVGGNTILVRSYAVDSKGVSGAIEYEIKVYGEPTITSPTKTNFKVEDEITIESLGLEAFDSFDEDIADSMVLTLISGEQTAGSTLKYKVEAEDYLGNKSDLEFDVYIYGTPTINYDSSVSSLNVDTFVDASYFSAEATDSHGVSLDVVVTIEEGIIKGGTFVKYRLSTTDNVGNEYYVVTEDLRVYSLDDIVLNYDSTTTTNIKKSSHGEEFLANATNSFDDVIETRVITKDGGELEGGTTVDIYIVATDIQGNQKVSDLIQGIKVYDIPTVTYAKDGYWIKSNELPDLLFSVVDSFNKSLLFNVEKIDGSLTEGETITYRITAKDKLGNNLEQDFTLNVVHSNESVLFLYENDELSRVQRVNNGESYALPSYDGYSTVWYYGNTPLTNENGESLMAWNYEDGGYRIDLVRNKYIYSITYEYNGGNAVDSSTVKTSYSVEDDTFALPELERTGYIFDGWYSDDEFNEPISEVGHGSFGNKHFYAKWNIIIYHITYNGLEDAVNNENNPDTYTYEDGIELLAPTKNGYTFGGWCSDNGLTTPFSYIALHTTGDITVYASWNLDTYSIRYYSNGVDLCDDRVTLSFDSRGGSSVSSQIITATNGMVYPTIPTKSGYVFAGWYTTSACTTLFDFTKTINSNTIVYAKWIAYSGYDILYVGQSKSISVVSKSSSTRYYAFVPLVSGSITIYTSGSLDTYGFLYNSSKSSLVSDDDSGSSNNFSITYSVKAGTLYYVWPAGYSSSGSTTVTISGTQYPPSGGKVPEKWPVTYYNIHSDTFELSTLEKDYYTFDGWCTNSDFEGEPLHEIAQGTWGNLTLYAKWTPIEYPIEYHLDGGINNVENPETYNYVDGVASFNDPSKLGYTFGGWYSDENYSTQVTSIPQNRAGKRDLYAKWTINDYAIEYFLDGGTNSSNNPSTYTVNGISSFDDPTRLGYTFDGWYCDSEFETQVTSIPEGTTGMFALYAKWTIIDYQINYHLNDGVSGGQYPSTYTVAGFDLSTLSDPTKDGYAFAGWYSDENLENRILEIEQGTTGQIDLYAKWERLLTAKINANTENEQVVDLVDVKNIYGNTQDKFEFHIILESNDSISFKRDEEDIHFYHVESNELIDDGTSYVADLSGCYKFYFNANDQMFVVTPVTISINGNPPVSLTNIKSEYSSYDAEYLVELEEDSEVVVLYDRYGNDYSDKEVLLYYYSFDEGSYEYDEEYDAPFNAKYRIYLANYSSNARIEPESLHLISSTNSSVNYDEYMTYRTTGEKTYVLRTWLYQGMRFKVKNHLTGAVYNQYYIDSNSSAYVNKYIITDSQGFVALVPGEYVITLDTTTNKISINLFNSFYKRYAYLMYSIDGGNEYSYTQFVDRNNDYPLNHYMIENIIGYETQPGDILYAKWNNFVDPALQKINIQLDASAVGKFALREDGYSIETIVGGYYNYFFDFDEKAAVINFRVEDASRTISYFLNGGTNNENNPHTYTSEGVASFANPTRQGYSFVGWFAYGDDQTQITSIAPDTYGPIALVAKWELNVHSIVYHLNGGTNSVNNPDGYSELIGVSSFENPTKTGYSFAGWYSEDSFDNEITNIPASSTGQVDLYAKWELTNYDIVYHLDGGTNNDSNPLTYDFLTGVESLANPTRTGCTFAGWYFDDQFQNPATSIAIGVTGQVDLYAKWFVINYDIVYHLDGGTNNLSNPATYNAISGVASFENPTKLGFDFAGWFTDDQFTSPITSIPVGSTGQVDLYAKWAFTVYSISYNLGENAVNPQSNPIYYSLGENVALNNPTRENYIFKGWYDDDNIRAFAITERCLGDISLTARWELESGYTKIYTTDDFLSIKNNLSGKYILMNDLDFDGVSMQQISNFTGVLDGNFHTIRNTSNTLININRGTIENLRIVNDNTLVNVGAPFVINNKGTIRYCAFEGDIFVEENGSPKVGGIVYVNCGLITRCYVIGNISGITHANTGYSADVGGICGQNSYDDPQDSPTITYCYVIGNIYAEGNACSGFAGGIAGINYYGYHEISHCYFSGSVEGKMLQNKSNYSAGAGYIVGGYFGSENCYYDSSSSQIKVTNGSQKNDAVAKDNYEELVEAAFGDSEDLYKYCLRDTQGNPVFPF